MKATTEKRNNGCNLLLDRLLLFRTFSDGLVEAGKELTDVDENCARLIMDRTVSLLLDYDEASVSCRASK
jgi:hypothetical protein